MSSNKKILIASGGSGGHIFPAISLAKELEKSGNDVIFVASRRKLDKSLLQGISCKKIFLSANPMPYRFGIALFIFWIKLIADGIVSFCLIMKYKPDVMVGFGGYTAGSIMLIGCMLRIKTIIHEQNIVPGRTNRFLDRYASKIAVSFEETKKHFKNKNVYFTGNPLRPESLIKCGESAFSKLGLLPGKKTILVMGGSQGARSLNKLVGNSIASMPSDILSEIQVLHIAGPSNAEEISSFYREKGIVAKVFSFVNNINEAYSIADVAISRAGAAAIFELAAFKKPMILVPYPNPMNSQRLNAQFFAKNGAAISIDEKTTTPKMLSSVIEALVKDPNTLNTLSENAGRLSVKDGAKKLKELILNEV